MNKADVMKAPELWLMELDANETGVAICSCSEIEAIQADAQPQWQDISEAPKDRTQLLCYDREGLTCVVLLWHPDSERWTTGVIRDEIDWKPTHFMPLPNPPKA